MNTQLKKGPAIPEADETEYNSIYTDYRFYQKHNGRDYMVTFFYTPEENCFTGLAYFSSLDDEVSVYEEDQETGEHNTPLELINRVKDAIAKTTISLIE